MSTIGIDIGGSTLRLAVVDQRGQLEASHKQALADARDPAFLCAQIAAWLAQHAPVTSGPHSVGVGIAAMLGDHQGTVVNAPNLGWRHVKFGDMLRVALGPAYQVGIYNDLNAIAYGEATHGAGQGCADSLTVFVGTGIGAGLVLGGKLHEGATNCAGELGHVKVAWDSTAPLCGCGALGCVEAVAGGAAVQARIHRELASGASVATVIQAGGLAAATPSHVDAAAAQGDEWALALWREVAGFLAIALGNALALLNVERLILGGGLLMRTPVLVEHVLAALELAAPRASLAPLAVVMAQLGDDAGLVGAARLAAAGVSTANHAA